MTNNNKFGGHTAVTDVAPQGKQKKKLQKITKGQNKDRRHLVTTWNQQKIIL